MPSETGRGRVPPDVVNENRPTWWTKTVILGEWKPANVPSKTFSWNIMPYDVHLVPLKTFSQNQISSFGGEYYLHIGLPHYFTTEINGLVRASCSWVS